MTVQLRRRHLLMTIVLCCEVGIILSNPVTTTPTSTSTTSITTTPDPTTSSTDLSSVSPPQSSSSSSSSSSFVSTSSHISTSVSSSSSSSSTEKDTPSHDTPFTSESEPTSSTIVTDGNELVLQHGSEPENVEHSDPSSSSNLNYNTPSHPSEDASSSSSSHADETSLSPDLHSSSPVEAPPSNQLLPSLHSDDDNTSVTSTSHSPLQPENNIPSPSQESSTDDVPESSTIPSSEEPPTTQPSPSDVNLSHSNESPSSLTESRTSSSDVQAEPESLSPIAHHSSPSHEGIVNQSPSSPGDTSHSVSSSAEEFYNLTQEFYQWRLQDSPQYATDVGINEDNMARLDDYSLEHYHQKKLITEEFLDRALLIDTSKLSQQDHVQYKVFVEFLSTFIRNFKYIKFFTPVSFMGGPHQYLLYIVKKSTTLESLNDYKKLILRYKDYPRQSDQFLELMKGNIANGLMPSNWSMRGVVQQFDDLLVPFNESVLYNPFKNISIDITDEEKEALRQEAEPALEAVLSAFKKMRDFIQEVYYPAARPEVGVFSLPEGLDYYKACLEYYTSTKMTPQEVHDVGLSEVARIHKELEQTAVDLGMPNKTLAEISAAVKKDPKMKFSSKEDLLETYRRAVYNDIYPLMDQIYDDIPDTNVTIEENVAGDGYASYSDPPKDGSRPGTFFLNAKIYDHHRRYEVNALSLHETLPGHHMQAIVHQNLPNLPEYLSSSEYYPLSESPAKYPLHTAYIEGWGLYSEHLGNELGLYKDPYQRLGRHSFEFLRASRLVVDTGMHALGWSRQEAINYLLENTAMSKKAIENQIDRYLTWPGQATAYKIGEIKILELRHKAEYLLGEYFRLQDFHKAVMECPGPLSILEECIDTYITTVNLG